MTARRLAEIRGDGLAAAAAALLFARQGWEVRAPESVARPSMPIVLNPIGRFLIEDLCGDAVWRTVPHRRLARRVLAWESGPPIVMAEETLVVDAAALAAAMQERMPAARISGGTEADCVCHCEALPAAAGGETWSGGRRVAALADVALADGVAADAFIVEAGADGWVILFPTGSGRGVLYAFGLAQDGGDLLASVLAGAPMVRRAVGELRPRRAGMAAAPRLHLPAAPDPACMPAGTAVMAFDPLSGDGAAVALRTAHLAVSLAQDAGGEPAMAAAYRTRLIAAMRAHVRGLLVLYKATRFAQAWAGELAAMQDMYDRLGSDTRLESAHG